MALSFRKGTQSSEPDQQHTPSVELKSHMEQVEFD